MVFLTMVDIWRETVEELGGLRGFFYIFLVMVVFTLIVQWAVGRASAKVRKSAPLATRAKGGARLEWAVGLLTARCLCGICCELRLRYLGLRHENVKLCLPSEALRLVEG